jgi:hypothetical protein
LKESLDERLCLNVSGIGDAKLDGPNTANVAVDVQERIKRLHPFSKAIDKFEVRQTPTRRKRNVWCGNIRFTRKLSSSMHVQNLILASLVFTPGKGAFRVLDH